MNDAVQEQQRGERFRFGENWREFLRVLDGERIERAKESLAQMLETESLAGRTFLDIGSGSGLFSLAARLLGARVRSFDYDPQSVACTEELKRRYFPDDPEWTVSGGSALDREFLAGLGEFDIVYSWGVLHHTGKMWDALENAGMSVKPGGLLFISIYNEQGGPTRRWKTVKRLYNRSGSLGKWLVLRACFVRLWGPTIIRDSLRLHPLRTWRGYRGLRGMSPWRDVVDWVGGYPFETATPEAIFEFYRKRGYELRKMVTCGGGLGCNEFVFAKHRDVQA